MPTQRTLADRFWSKVKKTETCWIWTGQKAGNGYGALRRSEPPHKHAYAHRLSWEMHFGPIPDGIEVLHRCDNPPCIRPDHLFLGTQAENLEDANQKGRREEAKEHFIQSVRAKRKLSDEEVRSIREMRPHTSVRKLARMFNVNNGTISQIFSGRTYKQTGL